MPIIDDRCRTAHNKRNVYKFEVTIAQSQIENAYCIVFALACDSLSDLKKLINGSFY